MRLTSEWTEADLAALIEGEVQESLTLDYKRSDSLSKSDNKSRTELAKDVSAFANSAGGQIVYGIEEEGHRPVRIDAGSDPSQISREWIEQIINSTVQPRIQGIRYKAIPLESGGLAFVVDIPQSKNAPHQAPDKKYYRRYEYQSVAMHDYEVRDAMQRHTTPELTLAWTVARTGEDQQDGHFDVIVAIECRNLSPEPAMHTMCSIILDKELQSGRMDEFTTDIRNVETKRDGSHLSRVYRRHFTVPTDPPFFKEAPLQMARVALQMERNTNYLVGWQVATPGFAKHMIGFASIASNGKPEFNFKEVEEVEDS